MSDFREGQAQLGSGVEASTPTRSNLRAEAGEAMIQADRFASQVIRFEDILCQMGLREGQDKKVPQGEQACNPNDLNWTIRTTASTLRAANNQIEELINNVENEML